MEPVFCRFCSSRLGLPAWSDVPAGKSPSTLAMPPMRRRAPAGTRPALAGTPPGPEGTRPTASRDTAAPVAPACRRRSGPARRSWQGPAARPPHRVRAARLRRRARAAHRRRRAPAAHRSRTRGIQYVFVIAMENESATRSTAAATRRTSTASSPRYAHATAFADPLPDAIPSEPHYVWMEAGTNEFSRHDLHRRQRSVGEQQHRQHRAPGRPRWPRPRRR